MCNVQPWLVVLVFFKEFQMHSFPSGIKNRGQYVFCRMMSDLLEQNVSGSASHIVCPLWVEQCYNGTSEMAEIKTQGWIFRTKHTSIISSYKVFYFPGAGVRFQWK